MIWAHPCCIYSARSHDDSSLSERDLEMLDVFSREYLAARGYSDLSFAAREDDSDLYAREYDVPELFARGLLDPPQRESFRNFDDYEEAWLAWNKRARQMSKKMEKIKYAGPRPQLDNYKTHEEAQAAHTKWFHESLKASQQSQKIVQNTAAKAAKAAVKQAQHERKLDEQARKQAQAGPSTPKKPGLIGKLLGKGKAKRAMGYDGEWDLE